MPELPEVETVRRTLENFILNKKIEEYKKFYILKSLMMIKKNLCKL